MIIGHKILLAMKTHVKLRFAKKSKLAKEMTLHKHWVSMLIIFRMSYILNWEHWKCIIRVWLQQFKKGGVYTGHKCTVSSSLHWVSWCDVSTWATAYLPFYSLTPMELRAIKWQRSGYHCFWTLVRIYHLLSVTICMMSHFATKWNPQGIPFSMGLNS